MENKNQFLEVKSYDPDYGSLPVDEISEINAVVKSELVRLKDDTKVRTWNYGDGPNLVIDVKAAYDAGIDIVTPKVNRNHGNDQFKTGESTKIYGAQQLLLVITKRVADKAGMDVERFSNDTSKAPISDEALVILNGNGRMNYFFSLDDSEKPRYFATFIEPDIRGNYNPRKVLEVINTERTMWKTCEMVIKRVLEDGSSVHPAWQMILDLSKKGYKYQAACETCTLDSDRITKKSVASGNADKIFKYFDSAKKIHDALVLKFGEGDDKLLKTKEFPKRVSELWGKLRDKNGEDWATTSFVEFINKFDESKKQLILTNKSNINGIRKDDYRKKILDQEFNKVFLGTK